MRAIYLGLGSNLGDRRRFLVVALRLLAERQVFLQRASSLYESAPVGVTQQPSFLNAVVEVETARPPYDLLRTLQAVERALGRRRTQRWGPRTLDIDILLYGPLCLDEPNLQIPHPRMPQRRFVLLPLLELEPNLFIPGVGLARDCLAALDPKEQPVRRFGPMPCL